MAAAESTTGLLAPKRILMLTAKYEGPGASPYLTNELAGEFARQGHSVRVVATDWSAPPDQPVNDYVEPTGVRVLRLGPVYFSAAGQFVERVLKWTLSPFRARAYMRRCLNGEEFDLVFVTSPATVMAWPFLWARRRFANAKHYFYVTDFFPFHHRAIGLIGNGAAFAVAKRLETLLVRRFDVIGCMSEANVSYLEAHYRLRPEQRTEVLRLWGDTTPVPSEEREAVRRRHGLPPDKFIAVFGGQITEGRGIEEILDVAAAAEAADPDLYFVLIGDGRLAHTVDARIAAGLGNLVRLPPMPREAYLEVAGACDLGLVATVAGSMVPTFPSKTIDYLRAGLPIAASVEATSDYPDFVRARGFGIAVEAGDPVRFLGAVTALARDRDLLNRMRQAGRQTLADEFDVKAAARKAVEQSFLRS